MLLSLLVLLGSLFANARSEDSVVAVLSGAPASRLLTGLPTARGVERGATLLFLAVLDTTGRWSEPARASLDSLHRASRTPLRSVLLGTAEALRARDLSGGLKAAYWLTRSLRHLDAGVEARPDDSRLRIFRINSLVEVPRPFAVDERVALDAAALRSKLRGAPKDAEPAVVMALASVAARQGREREAVELWRVVVAREPADSPHRRIAERRMARIRP